ncbi:MAG: AMP-binding protein [Oscillospiraceae bacterium]|nr:AMP-binding protein [Oscillospiraceae bacterium]
MYFWDRLEQYSDRIAVIDDNGRSYSYQELIDAADTFALAAVPRSIVFLQCENSFASIASYIGFLRRRAIPVLLSDSLAEERLEELKALYRPQYICCREDFYGKGEVCASAGGYHLLKTGHAPVPSAPSLAVMITTSGSTGSAKFVMQSYDNVQCNTESIISYLGITQEDRAITTLPMSYTYGLSIIQTHLCAGACIIATESALMQRQFWTMLREYKATTFGGVPYTYEMLKKMRFSRMELPSLRYLTQAGGRLSKELVLEYHALCQSKGIRFIVMYGQTEATARMSYLPWEALPEKAGSIGIAIPGGTFSLEAADGSIITQPDEVGELVYRGGNVTLGYACCAEDFIAGDSRHGVLHTGDMAKVDSDGFYYLVGRKKRFLKIYGNRVNLDETENILRAEGYECVCGGRDDLLCVYLVGVQESQEKEMLRFLSDRLSLNSAAFRVIPVAEIPRNASGKVQYSALEEQYGKL